MNELEKKDSDLVRCAIVCYSCAGTRWVSTFPGNPGGGGFTDAVCSVNEEQLVGAFTTDNSVVHLR